MCWQVKYASASFTITFILSRFHRLTVRIIIIGRTGTFGLIRLIAIALRCRRIAGLRRLRFGIGLVHVRRRLTIRLIADRHHIAGVHRWRCGRRSGCTGRTGLRANGDSCHRNTAGRDERETAGALLDHPLRMEGVRDQRIARRCVGQMNGDHWWLNVLQGNTRFWLYNKLNVYFKIANGIIWERAYNVEIER